MADEVLMLAKNYEESKRHYPLVLTEKLDGVASDFYHHRMPLNQTRINARSRQGEVLLSVSHIQEFLDGLLQTGDHLIAELCIKGKPFKDISGLVRQHSNAPDLVAYVYDFYNENHMWDTYQDRMHMMVNRLNSHLRDNAPVQIIDGLRIENDLEFTNSVDHFFESHPEAEGLMIRQLTGAASVYKFGRSWGMQRLKPTGTADLRVVNFEEAEDKDGKPKGMVGRINVEWNNSSIIGAGPGTLTHKERVAIWKNKSGYIGRIAEIAYKPDASYEALREPRFLRWRDDKTQPNQE